MTPKNNNIQQLKNCYGCGVCSIACPHKIIEIKENNNGFYEPRIKDIDSCTNCGMCLKACSFHSPIDFPSHSLSAYAAWSQDDSTRRAATSGGIAYELSAYALSHGYNVCSVVYDKTKHRASHQLIKTDNDLKRTLGSKYIPSLTVDGFKELVIRRNSTQKYLVFGTPCQIGSLRQLLRQYKSEENFILVDIFCHGVPSLKVWDKYIKENNLDSKAVADIRWRDKKFGWHDSYYIVGFNDDKNEVYRSPKTGYDNFYQFFLSHYALNECCMESCKFKKGRSLADIRLGDLWGTAYGKDTNGTSGILCFTEKGHDFVTANSNMTLIKENPDIVMDGQMSENAHKPYGYALAGFFLKTNLSLTHILKVVHLYESAHMLQKRVIEKLKRTVRIS